MTVHGLDESDSRRRSKLLQARRAVAGRGQYYLQSGLRDTVGSLELLTLGPDLEQENQGVAVRAKKASFTSGSVLIDCCRSRALKADSNG